MIQWCIPQHSSLFAANAQVTWKRGTIPTFHGREVVSGDGDDDEDSGIGGIVKTVGMW